MSTKRITMKQKVSGGYDTLLPYTNANQVGGLSAAIDTRINERGLADRVFRVHLSPRTERNPFSVNYMVEYRDGVTVHCDKYIEDILLRVGEDGWDDYHGNYYESLLLGLVADYNLYKNECYKRGDDFYEHFLDNQAMTLEEDKIYVDITPEYTLVQEQGWHDHTGYQYYYNPNDGQFYRDAEFTDFFQGVNGIKYQDLNTDNVYLCAVNKTSYRYQPAGYRLCACEWWDREGYLSDGVFYEDSALTVEMEAEEYTLYHDLYTDRVFAYVAESIIPCMIEDDLMDIGHMQLSDFRCKGDNYVQFQLFQNNTEITFTGRAYYDADQRYLDYNPDLWSMNISKEKYQLKANLVQEIGKANPDLYPSVVAVMDYVNQNS